MPDHTPADKPDLPALPKPYEHLDGIPYWVLYQMQEYGRQCAEAARADERRKALEEAGNIALPVSRTAADAIRALIDKEPT